MTDDRAETLEPRWVELTVDLQEGFENDTVVVRLNGEEVYHESQVTTLRLLGLADTFIADSEPGPARLDVEVESRGLTHQIPLELTDRTYVGISLIEGRIEAIVSHEAFGYM